MDVNQNINNNMINNHDISRNQLKNKILDALIIKKLPDDVCISTMTICCDVDIEFNVNNIAKYIELNKSNIISIGYGRNDDPNTNRSLFPKKRQKKKKKAKRVFYNQVSLAVKIDSKLDKLINIKLFTNGSIQMTGCKSVDNVVDVIDKIFSQLKIIRGVIDKQTMTIVDKPFVNDMNKLSLDFVEHITIGMINSNFKYPNKIDRLKLFNLLTSESIECKYDPSNHACVNIKHHCVDKTISIFVFEKGPIVITGAKNCEHILSGYNFINRYLLTNHKKIIKSSINISNINMLLNDTHESNESNDSNDKDLDLSDDDNINNFLNSLG
jgi:TATA-box binding protein (TBP) (component of TFIID and TFIIIB)